METGSPNPPSGSPSPKPPAAPIIVDPHGAEVPLKIFLTIIGVILWILILVSIVGLFYAVIVGAAIFLAQLSMIVHLRGNSVKLGPQQMPGLYNRVSALSKRIGLKKVPDAYLVQSGGVLNAFATKYFSRNFIALYSDMVRACGDNMDALDFIIGHELGHLHRGHLRWRGFKAPAMFIPFLGSAYYRSCEYTCDRYGKQSCGDHSKCLDGLCLLASGPRYVSLVNRKQFATQLNDLNTVFMKLGSWFGSHPPLVNRAVALEPGLKPAGYNDVMSTFGAVLLAAILTLVPVVGGGYFFKTTIDSVKKEIAEKVNKRPIVSGKNGLNTPQLPEPPPAQ